MSNWKSYLNEDTFEWLLEDNNPSAKYYALTDLMGKKADSSEVKAAQSESNLNSKLDKFRFPSQRSLSSIINFIEIRL